MTTEKMDVRTFGDLLITTRDLDPAYVGLWGANLPRPQLARWLLAYWCFYHVGSASFLSEYSDHEFWYLMIAAAKNERGPNNFIGGLPERWPRAAERRHFRGQKCVDAVLHLQEKSRAHHPESLVLNLMEPIDQMGYTEKKVMARVQEWPMFGPWIAFKAADMLERVAGVPVKFDSNLGLMYEEPAAALKILTDTCPFFGNDEGGISTGTTTHSWSKVDWYNNLTMYFHKHLAPPARDRTCGPQEVETVLCKWKSYMGGHYHLGKDIHEHRGALAGWGSTASLILHHMPEEVTK